MSNKWFGFINANKPSGMTSRDLVNVVQRRLRPTKVGHAGTLDPLAEGVLVLGIGPAARLVPYVQQQTKHYRATFLLGQSSETGDLENGSHQHQGLPIPDERQLVAAAAELVGTIQQTPPAYSAIQVGGQRAYKLARAGKQVTVPSRWVEIHELRVLRYAYPELDLDIRCGSGTYIRTLGLDLAKKTGSVAVMAHLQRVGVGKFSVSSAVSMEQLRESPLDEMMLSPLLAVEHLPRIEIDVGQCSRLGNGLCLEITPEAGLSEAAAVDRDGRLRAIVRPKRNRWCPYRVFPA